MPYNNVISRGDVVETPDTIATEIAQNATQQSAVMQAFRRANVSKRQNKFPVLTALPTAYWVNGDTGLKQTTQMAWANKFLNVEELAVIVPIPENVVDDADFDVWGEVRPRVEEAVARAVDDAVLFGTNAPATFPTNVRAAAIAAGNKVITGTSTAAQGGAYGDLDLALGQVEDDGYDPSGAVADRRYRSLLRRARNTQGERLDAGRLNPGMTEFDGDPILYTPSGLAPAGFRLMLGDWSQFVFGLRKDMTYKVLDQAVIQDNTGAIIYNLAQQDMVALRVTFRAGWQVANPINYAAPVEANRYPVSVVSDT